MEDKDILDLRIDDAGQAHLLETAKWAKFLAIIGFVMVGLVLISAFSLAAIFGSYFSSAQIPTANPIGMSAGFIIVSVLMFIGAWLLFQFSTKLKKSIQAGDQETFNQALSKQKMYFKYIGILVIVYLCLLALIFILGILGVAMASRG